MAQKADLRGKINLDSSGFKRGIQQAKGSVGTFVNTLKGSLLPALGAAGAAGALMSFGRRAIESASQIKELSQVSGVGVVEFQKLAEAAKTVNMEQEKLADIFKDTSDKVGDFINTGGGPMADFFEKIAPLVGATKEEFMGLSGPESLQKYFNFLKEANLPHQEMVFYMEAIASDATMLIPLLENGGEAFKKLGAGAEEAGNIMNETTIEALDQANEEIDRFMQNVTIFVGQFLAKLRPAKDELRELAIEQLRAEEAFATGFLAKRIDVFTGGSGKLIAERTALLKKEAEAAELVRMQNEQNALTLAKIASIKQGEAAKAVKEAEMAAKLQKIKDKATSKPDFAAIEKAENARKEVVQEIRKTIKPDLDKEAEDGKDAGKAYSTGFFREFKEQSKLRTSDTLKNELVSIGEQREELRRVGNFSGDRKLRDKESSMRSDLREARGEERTEDLLRRLGRDPRSEKNGNGRQNDQGGSKVSEYHQKSIELKTSIKELLEPVSKYYAEGALFSLEKDAYQSQIELYKLTEKQSENIATVVEKLNRLDQALR
tara:strand:+ start:2090 stop:3730 length:1641 start_codon:yes stop_codon:yes gene_type:complete